MAGDPLPPAPPLALERPHERAEVCACHATAIIEFFTCASLSFSSRPRMPSKFSYVLRLPLGGLVLLLAELHGVVLHHLGLDLVASFSTPGQELGLGLGLELGLGCRVQGGVG